MPAPVRDIILASGSAVRRKLLDAAGVVFEVQPADVDEAGIATRLSETDCADSNHVALVLARAKAEQVSRCHRNAVVIGADQTLALGPRLFAKASDTAEAREHLKLLRGRAHVLCSAVVIAQFGEVVWAAHDSAEMTMRAFSDAFLDHYIDSAGEALTRSVGCYELEGLGLQLFEQIEGDYFTILGLPMMPLLAELRKRGAIST